MGRPTKLDASRTKRLCDALRKGLPRATAARLAGIDYSTMRNWVAAAKAGEAAYLPFFREVTKAEAEAEEIFASRISAHSLDSWQAAAWMLERRHPATWGPRKPTEKHAVHLSGKLEGTSHEERIAVAESVLAALRSSQDDEF